MLINIENAELWLRDLETTEDPQGHNTLTTPYGEDCCLGRLCKVAMANGVDLDVTHRGPYGTLYDGVSSVPPDAVTVWLGMTPTAAREFYNTCTVWNDGEMLSFPEIAERIREKIDD